MKKRMNTYELLWLMLFLDLSMLYEFYKSGKLAFTLFVLLLVAMNLTTFYFFRRDWKNRKNNKTNCVLRYRIPFYTVNLERNHDSQPLKGKEDKLILSLFKKNMYLNNKVNEKSFLKGLPFSCKETVCGAYFGFDTTGNDNLIVTISAIDKLKQNKIEQIEKYLKHYLEKQFSMALKVKDTKQRNWGIILSDENHQMKIEKYPSADSQKCFELFKQQTQRKGLKIICTDEKPELLDSKLGGCPYLPIDQERPKDSYGHPMGLLVQLNFKQVDLNGFPKQGIFEVFCTDRLSEPFESAVRFYQNDQLQTQPFDGYYLKGFLKKKEQKIGFEPCDCYMDKFVPLFFDTVKQLIKQQYDFDIQNINELSKCGLHNFLNTVSWDEEKRLNPTRMVGGYCGFGQTITKASEEWTENAVNIVRIVINEGPDYDPTPVPLCIAIAPDDLKEGRLEKARVFYDYNNYFNDMHNE